MEKIKVLLVDDEYLALQLLENFTQKVPELDVVAKTKSPVEAKEILKNESIDLLFLDIQMPTLSGVNLLQSLDSPPVTIFTTAYSDYAMTAFDLNAVDYLLKPFSYERFLQAVDKAKRLLLKSKEQMIQRFLSIKADSRIIKIYYDDILFIQGLKEYAKIVCENGNVVTFERLKNLEAVLPSDKFLRVHKSFIVNTKKVISVKKNKLSIDTHLIPISRGKKEMVVERIF